MELYPVAWEGDSREPTLPPPHSRISNNEALKTIENLTLPNSLSKLVCTNCGVQTIRGVRLSSQLRFIDFTGTNLTELEIRDSDAKVLEMVVFSGSVAQTTCRDATATLRQIQSGLSACVISNAVFEAKYMSETRPPNAHRGSSDSSTSPSGSSAKSTIIIIVIITVAAVTCLVAAVLVYCKCFKTPSHDVGDKYHELETFDAQGSSDATADSSGVPMNSSQEYLSNDIRNDEEFMTYRIAYDEIQMLYVIGRGGFGVIHLATSQGREVAIKQMLPDKAKDKRVMRSFMDEIRLCASLEHPRIVEFVGITWTTLQDIAVVNEYMAGGDLRAALDKQQQDSNAIQWFEASQGLKAKSAVALDVIVALVYLHSFDQPIIHRDLKARNVLLNTDGDAKLSDFGTSREALLDETMTGEIGTVAWIAPEVLRGERYNEKADIYSLGVLLVELDTAQHPYKKELLETGTMQLGNTRIALLVCADKLAPTPSDQCPSEIALLIKNCLSFNPANRPSAMDVHFELCNIYHRNRRSEPSSVQGGQRDE